MGRNASIQMFLLTLTGCSWMLLFLSITLPDYHVFREYHAAHVAAAVHTPPPRETDPCELCWGVGKACLEGEGEDGSFEDNVPVEGDTSWGARLAWAVGVGQEKRDKLSAAAAPEVGGVGAFYYYTLHTTFTALRVRLKKAQQVAGDVHEEVASLGERVAHLQNTLTTHFSPRLNPYLHKPRLTQPRHHHDDTANKDAANPPSPDHQKTKVLNAGKKDLGSSQHHHKTSTVDVRRENLRRVYPVVVAKPSDEAAQRTSPVTSSHDQVRPKTTQDDLARSRLGHTHSVYFDLPSQRRMTPPRGDRDPDSERTTTRKMHQVTSHETTSKSLDKKINRKTLSGEFGRQLSVNVTADPWRHGPQSGKANKDNLSKHEAEGTWKTAAVDQERSRGVAGDLGKGKTRSEKARARDWPSTLGVGNVQRTVSVVVMDGEHNIDGLLASLGRTYPGITVHLITASPSSQPSKQRLRLVVHGVGGNTTIGVASTQVLNHVTTPYVFITTGLTSLTQMARLERLVWAAEHLGVWAVSGGLQAPSGHWHTGCLTSSYAHYEVNWWHGRLGTAGECLLCQSLVGPFLAVTAALRHLGWDNELPREVIQLDLFLRASHSHHMLAAVYPKALFEINSDLEAPPRASLLSLARRHKVYSVQAAGGVRVTFSCSEVSANCGDIGLALPPCCRQELANLVRFTMDTCAAHGLLCELQEGTLLGAVKVGGVMPWERDADVTFHTKNFTALEELRDVFDRAGYSLRLKDNRWCCVDGKWAGGQGSLSSSQWRAELWSQHAMDSEDNILAGRPLTKVEFDGSWLAAPTSPGQYVRNRYGLEVFRHAQHWLDTGRSSGWEEYEAGKFLPCSRPAHHACLDQYVPDGNFKLHPLCIT
ncbi:uncharacterized protein [Panulirus ornatus]|uniref:uncharacterized protein n=1 Tax=Panulirus ornatus TaxID=150431 RepID=UPI003A84F7BB